MVLMMLFVRSTLVWLDAHSGNGSFSPELSNLHVPAVNRQTYKAEYNCVPILTTRSGVQVDDQLEAVVCGPGDGFLDIGQLALDIWLAGSNIEGPVRDRQPDMIQAAR